MSTTNQTATPNVEYLQNGFLNLGFGDKLNKDLEMAMERKQTDIQLHHRNDYNGDIMSYTLNLKKSDKSDLYFFNSIDATLKKEGQEQEIKQSFGIKKNYGVTAKEAYNLMDGRSIEKKLYNDEGTAQTRWLKLDFENKNQYGNYKMYRMFPYNLEREINKYPVELKNDYEKNELIRSLKKGNAQQITVEQDGQKVKYYLSANPAERTLDIYDANKNVVKRELLMKQDQRKEQKQEQQQDNKQTQKNTQQKKQGQSRKNTSH
ncbi:hypothetical protein [Mucilaginibacter sp.]|jgi:hypothetical protein|uniref:hypothetical protein n=1 Tax=Mucilaginibacter sp. TaxID=1882438 RepID=UPI0035645CAD